MKTPRRSKNHVQIEHLKLACRHVEEMRAAGISENLAIRNLEFFCDLYAKFLWGWSPSPFHIDQVPRSQWSLEALQLRKDRPDGKPKDHFRVEHGTPRRCFARMVMKVHADGRLTERTMDALVNKKWKVAVISLIEDSRLDKLKRQCFESPDERWAAAGIAFPEAGGDHL